MAIKPKKAKQDAVTTQGCVSQASQNGSPPLSVLVLQYRGRAAHVGYKKVELYKFRPGHLISIRSNLSPHSQSELNSPPIVVFQIKITDNYEFEQCGSGFPCSDESKAAEIEKVIERKNIPVPIIVKASWSGNFMIVPMTKYEVGHDEFTLHIYPEPKRIGAISSKFSLRKYAHFLGKSEELIMEEPLLADDKEKALELFKKRNEEIRAEELACRPATNIGPTSQEIQSLNESEFLVLEKVFPETVPILRGDIKASPEETYAAYQRDNFLHNGEMPEPIKFDKEQFLKVATELFNQRRRTKLGIDPVAYELVAGWFFKGYAHMTPQGRADELKKSGFDTFSKDFIIDLCARLKLPSIRKPGKH